MSSKNFSAPRIEWIDFAKGFVMTAVVWGHTLVPDATLNKFFFMFRMPFFFVMAGFLLNLDKWGGAENFKDFLLKLFKRLLIPYYLAELLFYPIWFALCHEAGLLKYSWGLTEIDPVDALAAIFMGNGALILAPLWFLPALFVAEIIFVKLFNFFGEINFKFVAAVAICAAVGLTLKDSFVPMGADISLVAQIFLLTGVLLRKHNVVARLNFKICCAAAIVLLTAFHFNDSIIIIFRRYGNPALFYAGGVAGTLLVIKFSMLLAKVGGSFCELIKYCGRQSMFILILHTIIANVCYELIAALTNFPPKNFPLDPSIVVPVATASVLIPIFLAKRFGKLPVFRVFCT